MEHVKPDKPEISLCNITNPGATLETLHYGHMEALWYQKYKIPASPWSTSLGFAAVMSSISLIMMIWYNVDCNVV